MTNFQEVLNTAAKHKKFLPIAYLVATYSVNELQELQTQCQTTIDNLNLMIENQLEDKMGMTKFQAFFLKNFFESQIIFIRRAKKHHNGMHEQQFSLMDGKIINFDLNQN
jgi:hypothetical protein